MANKSATKQKAATKPKKPAPRDFSVSGAVSKGEQNYVYGAAELEGYRHPSGFVRDEVLAAAKRAYQKHGEDPAIVEPE